MDTLELILPKTRLQIKNQKLIRFNENDELIMEIPLSDIISLQVKKTFEPITLVFLTAGLSVVLGTFFLASALWAKVVFYGIGIIILFLCAVGSHTNKIIINLKDSSTSIFPKDLEDEVDNFVVSLNNYLSSIEK